MPPKGSPQPSKQAVRKLTAWLSPRITRAAAKAAATQGRTVLRRLNRIEYENTVNDLLGIQLELKKQLPDDGSADGFDNAGAAHHTSSFLMEKYLEAADAALNMAISNRPKPPRSTKTRYSIKDAHPVRSTKEDVYRFLKDGEVVCFSSSEWHNVWISKFYPRDAGRYRFRISASGIQSGGKPVTFRVTTTGSRLTGKSGLIGYFDAPPDKPTKFEFVRFMEPKTTIRILPYGLAHANTVKKIGAKKWDKPGLAVQFVEVEGPLHESWPPESHRRIFGDMPRKNFGTYNFRDRVEVVSSQPLVDAERILLKFTRRAFRRTVSAADVAPFVAIVKSRMAQGTRFEPAVRAALKGVLISPEFLFLRETPGRLDDFALASRLSYFLWSTMPDETLLQLAAEKKLSNPTALREQVERMLSHPKSAAFTEHFVGQWLNLREIDATEPSRLLYPEYDHLLKVSMIREAELFFDEILKHDLSVTNFVSSDFTMLNGRLAKHYGIPGVDGWEFRKTTLPADSHRGGVLTMAGVLKVTANGTTTSPVMRGAWVLNRILGTPPAPPPDNVSAIDPDIRGATTIREQLAKHRSVPSCAVCHRDIDPPGFALENFDVIGGWRDHYRVTGRGETVYVNGRRMSYHKGKKVNAADVLANGRRFQNIDEFKQLLLADKPQLARALTSKLVTYATGRAPQRADRKAIEEIVQKIRNRRYGLRVAMGLPMLDALLPTLARAAKAAPVPRRMVCINTPLGLHPPYFFPKTAGRKYALSPYLDVLKEYRDDFTVVSGLSHPDVGPSHDSNQSFLTAAPHPERRAGFKNSISLDQFAAEHVYGQTRFPTLPLSCEGSGLAWTRSGARVPTENWPTSVFAKLFLKGRPDQVEAQARRLADGKSVLDAVRDQARRLQRGLGTGDRQKLDEYFTSIRELERRLAQAEFWAKKPKPKVNVKPPVNVRNSADLIGKTRVWFDLIHLALQTDSTRLVTLQLLGTSNVPPIRGVSQGHHDLSHHGKDPAKIAQLKILEMEKLKTLRDFLKQLKETREQGVSLLDRTMVFFSSNLGDAGKHSVKNMPVLLAGGGFQHGQHLAFDESKNPPLCNLFVSMLQRMEIPTDNFGSSTGTLTGLEMRK
eukprot:g26733.t1